MTEFEDNFGVLGLVATGISRYSPKHYRLKNNPILNYSYADPQDFISEMFWEAIFSREKVWNVLRS